MYLETYLYIKSIKNQFIKRLFRFQNCFPIKKNQPPKFKLILSPDKELQQTERVLECSNFIKEDILQDTRVFLIK